jgi:hypothetical protein
MMGTKGMGKSGVHDTNVMFAIDEHNKDVMFAS